MITLASIELQTIDWCFIIGFLVIALVIGYAVSKKAGSSSSEFFLSGRGMPWWLLGFSMVATTFSTDTPNLVAGLVREKGVAGNWAWWAFLVTGIVTVFFFAKLWRRSGVLTDLELYKIRYSGKSASFLRGFRAIYLGVIINVFIMASVSLAAIKIGETMLGWNQYQSVGIAMVVTVIFSSMGGFKGVIITDFVLFIMSMVGSFGAAYFAVNHEAVGGLSKLITHENVVGKLSMYAEAGSTSTGFAAVGGLLLMPLLVQWWSSWYPGAEPGGGGYIAQRMLAAKDEDNAVGSVFFFQVAHYAIRPWPWILVALASLVIYPTVADIQTAFPNANNVAEDSGYSAMLVFLPAGWLGLVLTSLIAAYMSTISTHLNWGASYVVNDFWKEYVEKNASERRLVWIGRIATVIMMALAALVAFNLTSASQTFNLLVSLGAGTGGVLLARWFWWRVNAISEIVAIISATIVALFFSFASAGQEMSSNAGHWSIPLQVAIVTTAWLIATFVTKPTDHKILKKFVEQTNPGGAGWRAVREEAMRQGESIDVQAKPVNFPIAFLATVAGCMMVYGMLFSAGYFLFGESTLGFIWSGVAVVSAIVVKTSWRKLS
ncbi:MAG: sodium:solute symporter family protein [Akkermansiaceae bacterium]